MQGRNYSTYSLITNVITTIINTISSSLGYRVAASHGTATVSPEFYVAPISLQSFNLAPVHTSGMNFVTYVLCVLMWLGSTFIVSAMYPFGTRTEEAMVAGILARGVPADHRKQVSTKIKLCLHACKQATSTSCCSCCRTNMCCSM